MFGFLGYYIWRRRRGYQGRKSRVAGVARVTAYGLGVGLLLGGFSLRSAMADVGEASMAFGRELTPLADLLGDSSRVRVNGQSIFVGNAISDSPVGEVLDRFETQCHEHRAASSEAWAKAAHLRDLFDKIPEDKRASLPQHGKPLEKLASFPMDQFGTFRTGDDRAGVVLCFVQANGAPTDAKTAWREFNKTGDLSKIGNLRYAYVQRTHNGHAHVLTAWTEEKFNLMSIAGPTTGDTPGDDPTIIPRPPDSRRIFTASVDGAPYGVRMYESTKSPAEILGFYDAKMDADGWTIIHPTGDDGLRGRGYQKGSVEIALDAESGTDGTRVTLGELGRP